MDCCSPSDAFGSLGFNHGEHELGPVAKEIVRFLRCLPRVIFVAFGNDAAIGDRLLLEQEVRVVFPSRLAKAGSDIESADVGFVGRHG